MRPPKSSIVAAALASTFAIASSMAQAQQSRSPQPPLEFPDRRAAPG